MINLEQLNGRVFEEDDMIYGWRARLGVLVPSGNPITEKDFNRVVPEGVSCHFHRFAFKGSGQPGDVLKDLRKPEDEIAAAAGMLLDVNPAVIIMTGTAVSFIDGLGYDQRLIAKMKEKKSDIPITTTSTSIIAALKALGVKNISVATPYSEPVSLAAVRFIEDSGIKVLKSQWLNKAGFDIAAVSQETLYHLVQAVDTADSEAVFISCTSLHTLDIIEKLEIDLQKPVITSNQVSVWNALRLAKIKDSIEGYGALLKDY
jgi:maleate cis-trans isomerase